jgi:putative transposase
MPLPAPQELRTYFTTAVTANRRRLFQVESNANLLLEMIAHYREQTRYELHAFVIMPDHLHLLLTPAPEVSLEKVMQFIKGGFSFRLKSKLDVWSRSFNQTQILTSEKFEACKNYIEQNPVRARLVPSPEIYNHSSAKRLDGNRPMPATPSITRREPIARRVSTSSRESANPEGAGASYLQHDHSSQNDPMVTFC